jgi:mono/diheme cytochrome c family protein
MPARLMADLDEAAMRDLVAYILLAQDGSLASQIESAVIPELPPPAEKITVNREQIELGHKIFNEKGTCAQCHSYGQAPEYHVQAPNLFGGSYQDPKELRRAITEPSADIAEEFRTCDISLNSGLVVSGRQLASSDPNYVVVIRVNALGNLETVKVARDDIELDDDDIPYIDESKLSLMPAGFGDKLTEDELQAVIAFILSMN